MPKATQHATQHAKGNSTCNATCNAKEVIEPAHSRPRHLNQFHEYFCFAGWAASLRSRPSADKNIKITIPLFSLLNHFGFPAETGFEMKFVVPNEFFFLIE